MSFEDLPPDWHLVPLFDPVHAANVVDLVVGERDRCSDSALLLPCASDGVPLRMPIIISHVRWVEDPQPLLDMWAHVAPGLGADVLVIATSHAGAGIPDSHLAWLRRVTSGLTRLGTRVVGWYVAAADGVHATV